MDRKTGQEWSWPAQPAKPTFEKGKARMDNSNNSNSSNPTPTNPVPATVTPVVTTIDPGSPAGTALADILNAADVVKPVLGLPGTKVDLKHVAKVSVKAQSVIPVILGLAIQKPELAPKGIDVLALLAEYQLAMALEQVEHAASGVKSSTGAAVRVKLAAVWQAVSSIYTVAQEIRGDGQVADTVAKVARVLARGPRTQKSTHTPIKPLPTGKKAQKALAMKANEAEAGTPAASPETPAATTAPSSAPTPTKVG